MIPLPYLRLNACTYAALALRFSLPEPLRKENIAIAAVAKKKRIHVALGMGGNASGNKVKEGENRRRAVSCRQAKLFMVLGQENRGSTWLVDERIQRLRAWEDTGEKNINKFV